jgi:hypothetical protein
MVPFSINGTDERTASLVPGAVDCGAVRSLRAMGETSRRVVGRWMENARKEGLLTGGRIITEHRGRHVELLHWASLRYLEGSTLLLVKLGPDDALLVTGPHAEAFEGLSMEVYCTRFLFCPLNHANASRLRRLLPFTGPSPLADHDATFGVGDRLGVASPGHVRIMNRYHVAPVFAQQSLRELDLTGRTYADAIDAATWAVFQEGYELPWGADGDHLKTEDWVQRAVGLGCTMITADLSDYLHPEYADARTDVVKEAYGNLDETHRGRLEGEYLEKALHLDTGEALQIGAEELARYALLYGDAVEHARRLFLAGKAAGRAFDFEISIDETTAPTTPEAHAFVALELKRLHLPFTSLAPRFIGAFEKGVDYKGDRAALDETLRLHAAIARYFGYRLSIHSGSDKFSVFPLIGKHVRGRFHLKTSGTNWLQALEVVSRVDPPFFRTLHACACEVFPLARTYYHITPDLEAMCRVEGLGDGELHRVFDNPSDRQVLHVSYGEILKRENLRERLYMLLFDHREEYWKSLEEHIGKHLELIGVPARQR